MKKIYQFKIELKDSNPTIWRRIQVPDDISFSDFHDIIQLSMGWEHEHLYEFVIKKIRIYDFEEVFDDGSDPLERDSMDTFLDEILTGVQAKFTYLYDFEDNWVHLIQLEKILPTVEGNTYPICLEGEAACPPEDCGGIWQYLEYLKISANRDNPEYFEVMEKLGEDWNPYAFNCEAVNVLLNNYSEQWEEIYEEVGEVLGYLEANGSDSEDFDDVFFEDEFLIDEDIDYYSLDSTEGRESSDIKAFSKENKPGRNDPCHCGSGKKYKKCCMDREA